MPCWLRMRLGKVSSGDLCVGNIYSGGDRNIICRVILWIIYMAHIIVLRIVYIFTVLWHLIIFYLKKNN
jgi:hypothetical protein